MPDEVEASWAVFEQKLVESVWRPAHPATAHTRKKMSALERVTREAAELVFIPSLLKVDHRTAAVPSTPKRFQYRNGLVGGFW